MPRPLRVLERAPLEREHDVLRPQQRDGPPDEVVASVQVRTLQLRHHADPAPCQLDHVLEGSDPDLVQLGCGSAAEWASERREPAEIEVVKHDEHAVGRCA